MKITWGDLEVGHRIVGGWVVTGLTSTEINVVRTTERSEVSSWGAKGAHRVDETQEYQTFKRKDPWEPVEIVTLDADEIAELVGGQIIYEEIDGVMTYFAWPEDPDFRSAAASHLQVTHGTDVGDASYADLLKLHQELHSRDCDHIHIERKDTQ